jgi:hypothetical protein
MVLDCLGDVSSGVRADAGRLVSITAEVPADQLSITVHCRHCWESPRWCGHHKGNWLADLIDFARHAGCWADHVPSNAAWPVARNDHVGIDGAQTVDCGQLCESAECWLIAAIRQPYRKVLP